MELRAAVRRVALGRPSVLLVVPAGATEFRLAVEAELGRLGWPLAEGPSSADLLVICGAPDAVQGDWLDRLWNGVPQPRARVAVPTPDLTAAALREGHMRLLAGDGEEGRHGPQRTGRQQQAPDSGEAPHEHHHGNDEHDHGPGGHDGQSSDGHGPGGHEGHDMSGMAVAGLPMADRADDRDGLRLDQLQVPLGPVLPDWPSGLVLHLALQGDVVQSAEVGEVAGAGNASGDSYWDGPWLRAARGEPVERGDAARRLCAAHLDSVGRFLAVCGWRDLAARSRRVRDAVLSGGHPADDLRTVIGAGERSRALRWLVSGLGPLPASRARGAGVTGPALTADGDVYDRFRVWLDGIGRAAAEFDDRRPLPTVEPAGPRGRLYGPAPPSQALLDVLPGLLEGAEFAGARIIVASLDPDLDELVPAVPAARQGAGHG